MSRRGAAGVGAVVVVVRRRRREEVRRRCGSCRRARRPSSRASTGIRPTTRVHRRPRRRSPSARRSPRRPPLLPPRDRSALARRSSSPSFRSLVRIIVTMPCPVPPCCSLHARRTHFCLCVSLRSDVALGPIHLRVAARTDVDVTGAPRISSDGCGDPEAPRSPRGAKWRSALSQRPSPDLCSDALRASPSPDCVCGDLDEAECVSHFPRSPLLLSARMHRLYRGYMLARVGVRRCPTRR